MVAISVTSIVIYVIFDIPIHQYTNIDFQTLLLQYWYWGGSSCIRAIFTYITWNLGWTKPTTYAYVKMCLSVSFHTVHIVTINQVLANKHSLHDSKFYMILHDSTWHILHNYMVVDIGTRPPIPNSAQGQMCKLLRVVQLEATLLWFWSNFDRLGRQHGTASVMTCSFLTIIVVKTSTIVLVVPNKQSTVLHLYTYRLIDIKTNRPTVTVPATNHHGSLVVLMLPSICFLSTKNIMGQVGWCWCFEMLAGCQNVECWF